MNWGMPRNRGPRHRETWPPRFIAGLALILTRNCRDRKIGRCRWLSTAHRQLRNSSKIGAALHSAAARGDEVELIHLGNRSMTCTWAFLALVGLLTCSSSVVSAELRILPPEVGLIGPQASQRL